MVAIQTLRAFDVTVRIDASIGHLVRALDFMARFADLETGVYVPVIDAATDQDSVLRVDLPAEMEWSPAPEGTRRPAHSATTIPDIAAYLVARLEEHEQECRQRTTAGQMLPDNICPQCGRAEVFVRYQRRELLLLCPHCRWQRTLFSADE